MPFPGTFAQRWLCINTSMSSKIDSQKKNGWLNPEIVCSRFDLPTCSFQMWTLSGYSLTVFEKNFESAKFKVGASIIRWSSLLGMKAFSFVFLSSWITIVQLNVSNVIFCIQDLDEARLLAKEQRKPLLIIFRCEPWIDYRLLIGSLSVHLINSNRSQVITFREGLQTLTINLCNWATIWLVEK